MELHGEVDTVLASSVSHPGYIPAQQQLSGSLKVPRERQTDRQRCPAQLD